MLTIYFDTSFFIDLGDTDDRSAEDVLRGLNDLEVRYVRSPIVLREWLVARRNTPRSSTGFRSCRSPHST